MSYQYIGENGEFRLNNPDKYSYLYFPLANENGVMSCVTPDLGGDSKLNQGAFLMQPVSCENLHNDKSSRNIWCRIDGEQVWSLTGRSCEQQAELFTDQKEETAVEAGFMYHKVNRKSEKHQLESAICNFVPASGEMVELMKATVKNTGSAEKKVQILSAIPIYGRSADNIRDHRHVTALLHRIETTKAGVVVNPTMTFDERGHQINKQLYGVFGGNKTSRPVEFFPVVETFIGEGGNLEHPEAVYKNKTGVKAGYRIDGYEALGGLVFREVCLQPGDAVSYIFVMSYGKDLKAMEAEAEKFLDEDFFDRSLQSTVEYWQKKVNITCCTGDRTFDQWMKWISFQPMLRRIYGCSFLPHHDYGKGGRGWRDLWQDCLALLLMNPDGVRDMLINNFGGVRMDGTNATIIGAGVGEFIADRNQITRVWMDHGVWPFLTTNLYIQQTGDIEILLEESGYFKDPQICRGEERDTKWRPEEGAGQKDIKGELYKGSILEHLLIQHLTAFYDVGEHNHIRLRGADWNDALDLARERGESVAFTTMYAKNMEQIAALLSELKRKGMQYVQLSEELCGLLECESSVYDSVSKKQKVLYQYCRLCSHQVSGKKAEVSISKLQVRLLEMAAWICGHVRRTEWKEDGEGRGWYNGYYDNSGNAVEGVKGGRVRMMLTGQVFAVMSGIATEPQMKKIVNAADRYLYDAEAGGYRLNTDFGEIKMDLGRMFGFAYGHKENGAVFSHMTTMFASAFYQRHASEAGWYVIESLFSHCCNFEKSKIYPGIPEYIDAKGRGVYHYLTGAASWMLLTVVTQMFGIRGHMGDLIFDPQLLASQFDEKGEARIDLTFADRKLKIIYRNPSQLNPEEYRIAQIFVNGEHQEMENGFYGVKRERICKSTGELEIVVILGEK